MDFIKREFTIASIMIIYSEFAWQEMGFVIERMDFINLETVEYYSMVHFVYLVIVEILKEPNYLCLDFEIG